MLKQMLFAVVIAACVATTSQVLAELYSSSEENGGTETLSGQSARLKNQQDTRSSEAAFNNGLKSFEQLILRVGLLSVHGELKKRVSYTLEQAEKTLDACAAACEEPAAACLNQENVPTDTLDESACRMNRALCRARCAQDFATTISTFPDPTAKMRPLEQQQLMAKIGLMITEANNSQSSLRIGTTDLARPALAEGFRITLDNYAEYGVPPGETTVQGGANNFENCISDTADQAIVCISQKANAGLFEFIVHELVCIGVDTVANVGCGVNVLRRYAVR